jgi:dolichol-phosphate mannosyltransferase
MKTKVVTPTLNEEAAISQVIVRVPVHVISDEGHDTAIHIIDGDRDASQQTGLEKDAVVLPVKQAEKGSAMQLPFAVRADYFVMIDADDTYPPEGITDFVRYLSTYDVILDSLTKKARRGGAMTRTNIFRNPVLAGVARMLFKEITTDSCMGFWKYGTYVVDRIDLAAQGFEIEADMFLKCAPHGFGIEENAIGYRERTDRPKQSSISDGLEIAFLLKQRMAPDGGRAL